MKKAETRIKTILKLGAGWKKKILTGRISHNAILTQMPFHSNSQGEMTWKGLTCEKGHSDWVSQPTTAPFRVAESQVSACASWVLPRAFWSKKGLNLVVERLQSSINFIILGSERSW